VSQLKIWYFLVTSIERKVYRSKKGKSKKNWKEAAKDRRAWRDLAEKAKTHKGL
jgi:hypothetical protein